MNIVTGTTYGGEPVGWHQAEWVTMNPGVKAIRYETDYDLTVLLANLSIAGGLELATMRAQQFVKEAP